VSEPVKTKTSQQILKLKFTAYAVMQFDCTFRNYMTVSVFVCSKLTRCCII